MKRNYAKNTLSLCFLIIFLLFPSNIYGAQNEQYFQKTNTVSSTKVWNIKFNSDLQEGSITLEHIRVLDEKGTSHKIELKYLEEDKIVQVIPVTEYSSRTKYTMYISGVKSQDGRDLKESVKMDFTIEGEKTPWNVSGIQIGDSEERLIQAMGAPVRKDLSEYGFYWYIYNKDYSKYVQVGIQNGKVVASYTNSSELSPIAIGTSRSDAEKILGEPVQWILKGNTRYSIDTNESATYKMDETYITVFYDIIQGNKVTAFEIIDKNTEENKEGYYGNVTEEVKQGFEKEIFDLANAIRARNNLSIYKWDDRIAEVARSHSEDMAVNNYFSHTNLEGDSPFDRMSKGGLEFWRAAENIAAGQISAIYAHEGWMNSAGHRSNILGDCEKLGVGVYIGGSYHVYYTQNFYTPY